jgi:glycosyltransferase involved in cell wall biosynthesis
MFLRLKLMKIADGTVFYTKDEVKEYLSITKHNKKMPIIGLNNGIDINPVKKVRKNYDASSRKRQILFIGRTSQKSNFNILLEAFKHPNLNNITLNVIGNDESSSYFNEFQSDLIRKYKINFYGILTNEQEISRVANKCQIFVYPGAVGLSLIHAMAYGLPCLVHSNRLQHMPEIAAFKKGMTGLTFKPNDPIDLAINLSAMMSDPRTLNNMSENCLRSVENDFNTTKMALRFFKFIKELE